MDSAADLTRYAANRLDEPPMYFGTVAVRRRLKGAVLWTGSEWAVTTFGLEKTNGAFRIATSQLWDGEAGIGWIQAMSATDETTDLSDFSEGLRLARGLACGRLDRRSLRQPAYSAG
jgi:hypothetical protein